MKHNFKTIYLQRGYGQFPYILKNVRLTWHQQIPLHHEDLRPLKLDGLYVSELFIKTTSTYKSACELTFFHYWLSEFRRGYPSDMCLVLNKHFSYHISKSGEHFKSEDIPSGGKLQALDNTFIQMDGEHYVYEL